jgi:hypothetical protein
MNYFNVFKIFLGLKWKEITDKIRNSDILYFFGFLLCCAGGMIVYVFVCAGFGWAYISLFGQPFITNSKDAFGNFVVVGAVVTILLFIVGFLIWIFSTDFCPWIAKNWREAKSIELSKGKLK